MSKRFWLPNYLHGQSKADARSSAAQAGDSLCCRASADVAVLGTLAPSREVLASAGTAALCGLRPVAALAGTGSGLGRIKALVADAGSEAERMGSAATGLGLGRRDELGASSSSEPLTSVPHGEDMCESDESPSCGLPGNAQKGLSPHMHWKSLRSSTRARLQVPAYLFQMAIGHSKSCECHAQHCLASAQA